MKNKLSHKQVRVMDMNLDQLKALLVRREKGLVFLKFLISEKEKEG